MKIASPRVSLRAALLVALAAGAAGSSATHEARAEGGRRCHGSRPGCHIGAEPLCICDSKQASDTTCRWICGVLG
jgi:hypothetical protein